MTDNNRLVRLYISNAIRFARVVTVTLKTTTTKNENKNNHENTLALVMNHANTNRFLDQNYSAAVHKKMNFIRQGRLFHFQNQHTR